MKSPTVKIFAIFCLGVFLGIGTAWALSEIIDLRNIKNSERSFTLAAQYTNPYLECPGFSGNDIKLESAREEILDLIDEREENDDSLEISVYARDLNNGPWMGINEKHTYVSASLMKVPVMMILLKQVEDGRLNLQDKLIYEPEKLDPTREVNNDAVEAVALMTPGESYSVIDLMTRMIVYSSNEAFFTLLTITDIDDRNSFEKAVGVNWNEPEYPAMVSVKNYSGFFRVLYNATYLNREMSEFALSILAQTRFDFGVRAGTPEGTIVANKYGNQEQYQPNDKVLESRNELYLSRKTKFLHDCGIVYHPLGPYALCVMTSSAEKSNIALSEIIADISAIVYKNR
ncbi:serine hydrolase [bacterium]|nr:serine hydrolase [bacterium]NCQ55348.1 serine hydrolase [Candidatus Parcubacteria bacterium]NCS96765.1 serine hydrolase [bacterium]